MASDVAVRKEEWTLRQQEWIQGCEVGMHTKWYGEMEIGTSLMDVCSSCYTCLRMWLLVRRGHFNWFICQAQLCALYNLSYFIMQFDWLHHNSSVTENQCTAHINICVWTVCLGTWIDRLVDLSIDWLTESFGRTLSFQCLTSMYWIFLCHPSRSDQCFWREPASFCFYAALFCSFLSLSNFYTTLNLSG